jgi:hypothetical protein
LFKVIYSTGAKGSTQTNQKNKLGLKRKEQEGTEGSPGLAHRTVRCATGQCLVHQGASSRTLHLRVSQAQLRYNSSDSVRCTPECPRASGATTICAQRSTLQSEQWNSDVRADGQRGTGLSGVAPDYPLPHEDKASNGRPAPSPNGKMTWRHTGHCPVAHRTVRCAHRQQLSPTATIWLVAINTTPTGHFNVREPKQHSKSSS